MTGLSDERLAEIREWGFWADAVGEAAVTDLLAEVDRLVAEKDQALAVLHEYGVLEHGAGLPLAIRVLQRGGEIKAQQAEAERDEARAINHQALPLLRECCCLGAGQDEERLRVIRYVDEGPRLDAAIKGGKK